MKCKCRRNAVSIWFLIVAGIIQVAMILMLARHSEQQRNDLWKCIDDITEFTQEMHPDERAVVYYDELSAEDKARIDKALLDTVVTD